MVSGYFPVVGTAIALADSQGAVELLVPKDERDLAKTGFADAVIPFESASLQKISTPAEAIREPLRSLLQREKLDRAVIGYEAGDTFAPASYASMHLYGASIRELCRDASLKPAAAFFARMRAKLTAIELDRLRRACRIANRAFEQGKRTLAAGLLETQAAAAFRAPLVTIGIGFEGVNRAEGYVSCMAGQNSSKAFGAYARSRASTIAYGDLVLTHCNSHADGYWTDITRTYCIGQPDDRQQRMYQAVFEARSAGLAAICPGATGSQVDLVTRDVMRSHGLGANFKHASGHGVGFTAIDHNAIPRLHPQSHDRLEAGMVFNLEPGAYIDGFGGLRHCDVVAVTRTGAEVLTPWQGAFEDLIR